MVQINLFSMKSPQNVQNITMNNSLKILLNRKNSIIWVLKNMNFNLQVSCSFKCLDSNELNIGYPSKTASQWAKISNIYWPEHPRGPVNIKHAILTVWMNGLVSKHWSRWAHLLKNDHFWGRGDVRLNNKWRSSQGHSV